MSFKSFLQKIGEDFKKIFESPITHDIEKVAGAVLTIAIPPVGSLFNATVSAVQLAEANFAALGKQNGSGAQKAAAVLGIVGGLIKQGLADAGKSSDDAAVQKYIDGVVAILNSTPSGS